MRVRTLLFVLGCVLRLVFHVLQRPLTWDASVYAGMAKAIVTAGQSGLWEPLRPLVWPLLLTPAARTPFLFVWAHVLQFLFGVGVLFLVYRVAKEAFGEREGLWALGVVALSPALAFYEHQLLTEQVSVFFALLAIWLVTKGHWSAFGAGLAAAFSFLTKFPQGLVFAGISAGLTTKLRWKTLLCFGCGFALPVLFFLCFNAVMYQNPLASVVAANDVIQTSGLWLYEGGVFFYFVTLIGLNVFCAFALSGVLLAWRKQRELLFVFVFVLAYWSLLPHKEVRFVPLLLPFVAILAGAGWSLLCAAAENSRFRKAFALVAVLLVAVAGVQAVRWTQYYLYDEGVLDEEKELLYVQAASLPRLVSSDPRVVWWTNEPVVPLYYPLFPETLSGGLDALEHARTLLFNPCDTPCSPSDMLCLENRNAFERIVRASWSVEKEVVRGECTITLFTRS